MRGAGAGTESQLRVSWDSILNAEQTGRWWIVGSAWSGAPMIDSSQQKALQKPLAGTVRTRLAATRRVAVSPAPPGSRSGRPLGWVIGMGCQGLFADLVELVLFCDAI